jgi:hypothetical protein
MKRTICLVCLFLLASVLALQGAVSETPMHLAGGVWDSHLLSSLLRGVSDTMAELYGIPFQFYVSGYQMADQAFIFTTSAEMEHPSNFLEPHIQQVFDRVGDLAVPFLRGLPIYLGVVDSMTRSLDPQLWAVLTYNDPSDIVVEYIEARPAVLKNAREFSHVLERALGEGVALAMDGCLAVPGLGAYIELMPGTYSLRLPEDLDSYGEWKARLLDLVESDGASLFTALAADESLCVVTPDGFYRMPDDILDLSRMFFMIPSVTYLDTSTWQSWTQDW